MIRISFPSASLLSVRQLPGKKPQVLCLVRRRWIYLTEEEWVRQHILLYFSSKHGYPLSLMGVEKMILIGERRKRFDVVIYQHNHPWMVVECKEPAVSLSAQVLQQALEYNSGLSAPFLLLTNGVEHRCWQLFPEVTELSVLPSFG